MYVSYTQNGKNDKKIKIIIMLRSFIAYWVIVIETEDKGCRNS